MSVPRPARSGDATLPTAVIPYTGRGQHMFRYCVVLFFFAALAVSVHAQATFGTITGTVIDPVGSVVPSASVKVSNQDTGLVKTILSDSQGNYEVTHLNPGMYS